MLFVGAKVSQYALLPQGQVEAADRVQFTVQPEQLRIRAPNNVADHGGAGHTPPMGPLVPGYEPSWEAASPAFLVHDDNRFDGRGAGAGAGAGADAEPDNEAAGAGPDAKPHSEAAGVGADYVPNNVAPPSSAAVGEAAAEAAEEAADKAAGVGPRDAKRARRNSSSDDDESESKSDDEAVTYEIPESIRRALRRRTRGKRKLSVKTQNIRKKQRAAAVQAVKAMYYTAGPAGRRYIRLQLKGTTMSVRSTTCDKCGGKFFFALAKDAETGEFIWVNNHDIAVLYCTDDTAHRFCQACTARCGSCGKVGCTICDGLEDSTLRHDGTVCQTCVNHNVAPHDPTGCAKCVKYGTPMSGLKRKRERE